MSLLPDHQHQIDALARRIFPAPEPKRTPATPPPELGLDARGLLQLAFKAGNGPDIEGLFNGDLCGRAGESEARGALILLFIFYTRDPGLLEQLIRASNRDPSKFDTRRGSETFLQYEIRRALERYTGPTYNPGRTQPPLPAPILVDTSGEVAELRAEIAALRGEIGPLRDRVAYLEDVVDTQRIRIQADELEKRAYRSHLGTDADVLIEVAREVDRRVAAGRAEEDGSVYLPYDAVVTRLVGEDAPDDVRASVKARVTRAVAKADASNVLSKRTEQRLITRDEVTGQYLAEPQYRRHTFVRWGNDYTTMIESLATATRPEDAPKRGGWRPRCPHHPTAAVITTHRCSVCNLELKPPPEDPTPPDDTNLYQQEDPTPAAPENTSLSYIPNTPTVAVNAGDTNLYHRAEGPSEALIRCTFTPFGCTCPHPDRCSERGRCSP